MKTFNLFILLLLTTISTLFAQNSLTPCSHEAIIHRHLETNPNAIEELEATEKELQEIIAKFRANPELRSQSTYVIPVVMHVFHFGDLGKMDMDQALAGLEILNQDFNGLNDGWDTIDPAFEAVKGTMDITFCLATLDPDGNPTTGLIYHEDEDAVYNEGDLFQHAWDNYKYLNIYFPKYTQGGPSDFTAYAYYPSTTGSNNNTAGIFYSSIRWGYGNHSDLAEGDDWASVCTHEAGHYLNLAHTFSNGCSGNGDAVADTPPCTGGTIELSGCDNNDFTCGEHVNGENFMDYNHRCKKMFTAGQVERMVAAMYLPSRVTLWTQENLNLTGCSDFSTDNFEIYKNNTITVTPNPAADFISIAVEHSASIDIYSIHGQFLKNYFIENNSESIDVSEFENGIYFFTFIENGETRTGKFVINR